jgi:site-specific recombinase XerD
LTIEGKRLAELLLATREPFVRLLEQRELSSEYLRQSREIIEEFAQVCAGEGVAHPWQLRQRYLDRRPALRVQQPFSDSYLQNHGRELRYFLRWYQARSSAAEVVFGQLSADQLASYWTQNRRGPCQQRLLLRHLPCLLAFLEQRPVLDGDWAIDRLVGDYFAERHLERRGGGYGFVLTHRARLVTHRHLSWLEHVGHLPSGTAASVGIALSVTEELSVAETVVGHFMARVDSDLPGGLRQPLMGYLEYLAYERELAKGSIKSIFRTVLALCRQLAMAGQDCYGLLNAAQLDEVVSSLLCAPVAELLRRRQQVQARHSELRGFLRYLHREGLLGRDLATALISPPCYRSSTPPVVLSEQQVQTLLESIGRCDARGRRCYAILLLLTTYGLRPVDVSRLRLDDLHWREQWLGLVQSKTGVALTLPLLGEVAEALYAYLRRDRASGRPYRQVFLSLRWPHRPLRPETICRVVAAALREAKLPWASAKNLRSSVATHLQRQGEPLGIIQEILGQTTAETTQRYAVTDVVQLRQVLEQSER